ANPELKPGDETGYFIAKTVNLWKVMPDGSLATTSSSYANDVTLGALPALTKGGKEGYAIVIGPTTYWVAKTDVVIRHGKHQKVAGALFAKEPTIDDGK